MRKRSKLSEGKPIPELINTTHLNIRFNEVDSLGVVWHGHYLTYFGDGRNGFGKEFGLSYLGAHANGVALPIIQSFCEHKKPLRYGDEAYIETQFLDTPAAKIIFQYKIFRKTDKALMTTGKTVQVFMNENGELLLTLPSFFIEWKRKFGLLNS